MTSKAPSYITKNRLGIYYFQYCVPSTLLINKVTSIKRVFRKSLHTRNRSLALKKSRILWLIMDKLKLQFFDDHESYGKAMELLMHYEKYEHTSWDEVEENFLINLEEWDDYLLKQALQYRSEQNRLNKVKNDEIEFLKERLAFYQNEKELVSKFSSPKISNDDDNVALLILTEKWLDFKKPSLKNSSFESIKKSIVLFANLTSEICERDPLISELSEHTVRNYKQLLQKLPQHRNANNLINKSLKELCTLNLPPIAHKTFKGYLVVAVEFLRWCEKEGYSVNPKLTGILSQTRKSVAKDTIQVFPFSDEDLFRIFQSTEYSQGKIKRPSDYWVPLISLYTGARLGEICQLLIKDVYEVEGIWVFDINDDESKSLKTINSSKRIIPIHKDLLKLKILEYRDYMEKNGSVSLFPLEVRDSRGMFSQFTKRFGNRLKTWKIKAALKSGERKSFHSFRHTIRTRLVDISSIEESIIDSILGHISNARSIGEKQYTHSNRVNHKNMLLNKLKYPIDLKTIKNWESCSFITNL